MIYVLLILACALSLLSPATYLLWRAKKEGFL